MRTASFYNGRTLLHGQTFDAYELGCRAALAVLRIIEEDGLLARVRQLGEVPGARLQAFAREFPAIDNRPVFAEARGWGLLHGLEISPAVLPDERLHPFAIALQRRLLDSGLLLGGLGRVLIFSPPLPHRGTGHRLCVGGIIRSACWRSCRNQAPAIHSDRQHQLSRVLPDKSGETKGKGWGF